ncbi:MAG: aminodeoxychorismate synthase component I [Pseudomonadales bacterium]|nr:aminodeoxychorismate synthase component I [Pseudomonadales bacterium]MDG1442701.1 aminodeoxychorismate synthase component I [Pseudomonadales bacterium]
MTIHDNSLQYPVMIKSILLRKSEAHKTIDINGGAQGVVGAHNSGEWLLFTNPVDVVATSDAAKVVDRLNDVEARVDQSKLFAAGFISYEASPAFDSALTAVKQTELPLFCFGLFESVQVLDEPPVTQADFETSNWHQSISPERYLEQLAKIKKHIRAGDTYQVNYTFQRSADYVGDPRALFHRFAKDAPYAAYVELEDYAICSASPELFFSKTRSKITTKPMKGTARRGLIQAEDEQRQNELASSEKDRAENIMIVDMIRNDLGRVADTGSVKVTKPLQLEKYPTLWQMTSTVTAKTTSSCANIISALFPCASITGAPKIETMKIIDELETQARGLYTGSIGYIAPGGLAQFSVAIRTAVMHLDSKRLNYGVGSGIVWDSDPQSEYEECLLKSKAIDNVTETQTFQLLETLRWQKGQNYFLLEQHLARLLGSATYFDFNVDETEINNSLRRLSNTLENQPFSSQRVRLTVDKLGCIGVEATPLQPSASDNVPKIVRLGHSPINSSDPFYYHKTTQRQMYEVQRRQHTDCFDVLLWNEKNEVTEFTIANFVLETDGRFFTPPVSCGLLNGTYRQYLIDQGELQERVIYTDELTRTSKIFLINSVRKWVPVSLV